tara:strand:+ start:6281 stop:6568 length:288 start_codon:yes stop_codon:yes gene_type:complete
MKLDPQQKKIVKELSLKHNLTEKQIIEIIVLPFKFIRKEIKEIDFSGEETEEEFNSKVKNFNIPAIGKLYGSYYNFKQINNVRRSKEGSEEPRDN